MIQWIVAIDLPPLFVIFALLVVYLVLGSVFETISAMIITLPFVFPLILVPGYDPIWWGIINVIVIEVGVITPPIGLNAFVIHGMGKGISLRSIFSGILPFGKRAEHPDLHVPRSQSIISWRGRKQTAYAQLLFAPALVDRNP